MARRSPQVGRGEAVDRAACAVDSPCVVSSASCAVVASLGNGSSGSVLGSDCAVGAIVPCRLAATDPAGSTTSDLRRSSGARAGGRAMWRVRHQWTTSQARNGKESRAARIRERVAVNDREARASGATTARGPLGAPPNRASVRFMDSSQVRVHTVLRYVHERVHGQRRKNLGAHRETEYILHLHEYNGGLIKA